MRKTRKEKFLKAAEVFARPGVHFMEDENGVCRWVDGLCETLDHQSRIQLKAVYYEDAIESIKHRRRERDHYQIYWGLNWGFDSRDRMSFNRADKCRVLAACFLATMPPEMLQGLVRSWKSAYGDF